MEKKRASFPDLWWGENGLFVISGALHAIIEDHDLGKHHMWPVKMFTKRHEPYPQEFYALVPGVHAAAISEAESDVFVQEERYSAPTKLFPKGGFSPRSSSLNSSWDAAVDVTKQPSGHLWWDHGLTDAYLLASDALHNAIKDAGLKVIPMKKLKEL